MFHQRTPLRIRTARRIGRIKRQDEIRDCPEPLTDPKHGAGPSPFAHRGGLADLDEAEDESFARILKSLLQKYDRLFDQPLPYVMAMHQKPPGRRAGHHHFHVEFYPPNRSKDKLKYLAGSEIGAGAFILDARAEDTAAELRGI